TLDLPSFAPRGLSLGGPPGVGGGRAGPGRGTGNARRLGVMGAKRNALVAGGVRGGKRWPFQLADPAVHCALAVSAVDPGLSADELLVEFESLNSNRILPKLRLDYDYAENLSDHFLLFDSFDCFEHRQIYVR
ncbi:hypothetical protein THAOC_22221, partial [Thalassiosira oceanica]